MSLLMKNSEALEILDTWLAESFIQALDVNFARMLNDLSSSDQQGYSILLAAITAQQAAQGHVCISIDECLTQANKLIASSNEQHLKSNVKNSFELKHIPFDVFAEISRDELIKQLRESEFVTDGSTVSPLVLNGDSLYLRRMWLDEGSIASAIKSRLGTRPELIESDSEGSQRLRESLSVLFPEQSDVDYQRIACALAARSQFAVITGGPGTGKTTTVVKLLAALQSLADIVTTQHGGKFRIRLAAPTGKAAARLNESIRNAVNYLELGNLSGEVNIEDIPTQVTTVHRLLGSQMGTKRFKHNEDNELPVDILVIDEASMLDVSLLASVVAALPANAQLILIGDKDQLSSVEAGAILGELCENAKEGRYSPEVAEWISVVSGHSLPVDLISEHGTELDQCVAMLRKSWRFSENSGIEKLSRAINDKCEVHSLVEQSFNHAFNDVAVILSEITKANQAKDTAHALNILTKHAVTGSPSLFEKARERALSVLGYKAYLEYIRSNRPTDNAAQSDWDAYASKTLTTFNDFRLLAVLREGTWGVKNLNDVVEKELAKQGLIPKVERWYAGRPIMVTSNDYNLNLMNGDVGIAFGVPWGNNGTNVIRVAFVDANDSSKVRWVSPSRLPVHETVYAMTVHKSQGSEFTHTCLVMPQTKNPVLTKELIYTAITRSKDFFSLFETEQKVLIDSSKAVVSRNSGLLGAIET